MTQRKRSTLGDDREWLFTDVGRPNHVSKGSKTVEWRWPVTISTTDGYAFEEKEGTLIASLRNNVTMNEMQADHRGGKIHLTFDGFDNDVYEYQLSKLDFSEEDEATDAAYFADRVSVGLEDGYTKLDVKDDIPGE